MEFSNYTLHVGKRCLLRGANFAFEKGAINHILGSNGIGKSQFAKDLLQNNSGQISGEISGQTTLIASFSSIPKDANLHHVLQRAQKKYEKAAMKELYDALGLGEIDATLTLGHLSDGQKQKIKLCLFLSEDKHIIVLDEITNALDKKTTYDLYEFLNQYIAKHPEKYILNITHNLQDLAHMAGTYSLFEEENIVRYSEKDELVDKYVRGV